MGSILDFVFGERIDVRSECLSGKRQSVAARWVRNVAVHAGPRPELDGVASVSDSGSFVNGLFKGQSLSPEKALALAHWIIDTFGEPEAKTNDNK